jgi:hypothetical protein
MSSTIQKRYNNKFRKHRNNKLFQDEKRGFNKHLERTEETKFSSKRFQNNATRSLVDPLIATGIAATGILRNNANPSKGRVAIKGLERKRRTVLPKGTVVKFVPPRSNNENLLGGRKRRKNGGKRRGVAVAYTRRNHRSFSKTEMRGDSMLLHGADRLGQLIANPPGSQPNSCNYSGFVLFEMDVNPGLVGERGRTLARTYEMFEFLEVKIWVEPSRPTSTAGSIAGFFDRDPIDQFDGKSGIKEASTHESFGSYQIWQTATWQMPKLRGKYYIQKGGTSNADVRQQNQATFRIMVDIPMDADILPTDLANTPFTIGSIYISYTVKLSKATIQMPFVGTEDQFYLPGANPGGGQPNATGPGAGWVYPLLDYTPTPTQVSPYPTDLSFPVSPFSTGGAEYGLFPWPSVGNYAGAAYLYVQPGTWAWTMSFYYSYTPAAVGDFLVFDPNYTTAPTVPFNPLQAIVNGGVVGTNANIGGIPQVAFNFNNPMIYNANATTMHGQYTTGFRFTNPVGIYIVPLMVSSSASSTKPSFTVSNLLISIGATNPLPWEQLASTPPLSLPESLSNRLLEMEDKLKMVMGEREGKEEKKSRVEPDEDDEPEPVIPVRLSESMFPKRNRVILSGFTTSPPGSLKGGGLSST